MTRALSDGNGLCRAVPAGARFALRGGRVGAKGWHRRGARAGLKLSLVRKSLAEAEDAVSALSAFVQSLAPTAAILDLPADDMLRLAEAWPTSPWCFSIRAIATIG